MVLYNRDSENYCTIEIVIVIVTVEIVIGIVTVEIVIGIVQ